ncbi:MAG: glycosyl hydrolase 115 family protein [Gemmiger sp.]|nr:glycosyl hydrolase 115 family protein [Gemmiger sp.]
MPFFLTAAVRVTAQWSSEPIRRAAARFMRDVAATLSPAADAPAGELLLCLNPALPPEQFTIDASGGSQLVICAPDDLGAIYALLHISTQWLGVTPLWFWNDQHFTPRPYVAITQAHQASTPAALPYRGWAMNDAVLLTHWNAGTSQETVWEMVFEALLRCGGNLVLPDAAAPAPAARLALASAMGLWLAQPAAAPLGAAPFAATHPGLTPGYNAHPGEYQALWAAAVAGQKGQKNLWTIGYTDPDPACATPAQRADTVNRALREQYRLIRAALPQAPIVTYLKGETLSLYRAGLLAIPRDVIRLWGDNGYGKMVSPTPHRAGPRLPTLPPAAEPAPAYPHGVYYHLSHSDLRAGNQLTMLPNSMEFVCRELSESYQAGVQALWLLGVSNLKPHVYPISVAAALWRDPTTPLPTIRENYLAQYYGAITGPEAENAPPPLSAGALASLAVCLEAWPEATAAFGPLGDQHGGEQFANYTTRILATQWLRGEEEAAAPALAWATGDIPFAGQIAWYRARCAEALTRMEPLWERCEAAAEAGGRLWQDNLLLQVRLYALCLHGAVLFCDAWVCAADAGQRDYKESFYLLGCAADDYAAADKALREAEHDKWAGFYANDCHTDVKLTARLLRTLMGSLRAKGDGPYYNTWQQQELYPDAAPGTLPTTENHLPNDQLYLAMARRRAGATRR